MVRWDKDQAICDKSLSRSRKEGFKTTVPFLKHAVVASCYHVYFGVSCAGALHKMGGIVRKKDSLQILKLYLLNSYMVPNSTGQWAQRYSQAGFERDKANSQLASGVTQTSI